MKWRDSGALRRARLDLVRRLRHELADAVKAGDDDRARDVSARISHLERHLTAADRRQLNEAVR